MNENGLLNTVIRPRLPVFLRYGAGWTVVKGSVYGSFAMFMLNLSYLMFGPNDAVESKRREYVVVKDDYGKPVDMMPKDLAEAAMRARERSRKMRDGDL